MLLKTIVPSIPLQRTWAGSDAQNYLSADIDDELHLTMGPKDLYETRDEYRVFSLATFRATFIKRSQDPQIHRLVGQWSVGTGNLKESSNWFEAQYVIVRCLSHRDCDCSLGKPPCPA